MKHVLLIDDDQFIRDLVGTKLIESNKYSVAVAATGEEGLLTLQHKRPDIILLDLDLPDTSGLQILEKLQSSNSTKAIPVIMFSNNDDPEKVKSTIEAGAVNFFLKVAVDMCELEKNIDAVLQNH